MTSATESGASASAARSVSGCTRPTSSTSQPAQLGALVLGQPVGGVEHGVVLDGARPAPGCGAGRPRAGPRRCP